MRKLLLFAVIAFLLIFAVADVVLNPPGNASNPQTNTVKQKPVTEELKVKVLKSYMTSMSHAAFDVEFINESSQYLKHWSIQITLYDKNEQYLGKGEGMVSEVPAGGSKITDILLLDTNLKLIESYKVTLTAIVGSNGLRIDNQFNLSIKE